MAFWARRGAHRRVRIRGRVGIVGRVGQMGRVGRVGNADRVGNVPEPERTGTWNPIALARPRVRSVSAAARRDPAHRDRRCVGPAALGGSARAVPDAPFIAAFSTLEGRRGFGSARWWGSVAPVIVLIVLVLSLAEVRYPILPIALAHLAAFTALAMVCHTRLAETRPDPTHLTGYFVCVSLGGVLGSAAVALIAPAVFSSILEYPLAIAAALLLRPQTSQADRRATSSAIRWAWRAAAAALFVAGYWCLSVLNKSADVAATQQLIRASFAIPAILLLLLTPRTALLFAGTAAGLLVGASIVRTGGEVLYRERTFFGVHEVTSQQNGDWHVLTHGTTTHGVQAFRGKIRRCRRRITIRPARSAMSSSRFSGEERFRDVAVVGLGAGALAGYAGNGVRMDFFEVDEAVIRIAENPKYFTYLSEARARPGTTVRTMAVDGRLGLRADARGFLRSHRRRCVFVGRDSHAPHHARGRGDVHVAPQTARRDRVPRVEPVFQPRARARADRRGSAPRVLHAERQGPAA